MNLALQSGLLQRVKKVAIFYDNGSCLILDGDAVIVLCFVVDEVEPRGGGLLPDEPPVHGPLIGLTVVLQK